MTVAGFHYWRSWLTRERIRRLGKEALWVAGGQALALAGALVGVRLLTELLPPEAYGELALGMTLATFLNQLILWPLGNGVTRFYAIAAESNAVPSYFASVWRMVGAVTGLVLLVGVLLLGGLAATGYATWIGLAAAAVVFALLSGYNSILDGIQIAGRQRACVAWHQGLASWGRFLIAAALVLVLGGKSMAAMWGYGLAMVMVLASQGLFFHRVVSYSPHVQPAEEEAIQRWQAQIFSYSWPFAAWGIATWAQQASDRWALGLFGSAYDVGQYAVLYQLGYYPSLLASGVAVQLIVPLVFQYAGEATDAQRVQRSKKLNRMVLCWTGLTTIIASIIVFVFYGQIFKIFVASQYASAAYLLPWMVLSGGIFAIGQIFSLEFLTELNTRWLIAPQIITALTSISVNVMGALLYGIAGIVAASVIGSLMYVVFLYLGHGLIKRYRAQNSPAYIEMFNS